MQAFSSQCRANLAHFGCDIAEEIARSTGGKQAGTQQSRASHFLEWCQHIKLGQDPCLPSHPLQARNYLIACYAVSLVRGDTLKHKAIRAGTIRGYVKAVCKLHTDRHLPSPYSAPTDYIAIVIKAVKKYEKVKNRRSMIHDEMIHHMEALRQSLHPDSLEAAIIDWIYLGRFVGYRSIEWCQVARKRYLKIEHRNWTGPDSYAFILEDALFYTEGKQPLLDIANLTIDQIGYFELRFKKQKNDRNYEVVPYVKDTDNPAFCPCAAILRICQRALRLNTPLHEPLAVYFATTG
ncbi:hypothetical protein ACHAXR_000751, partial [Thalassiosira sp. AJA248-18]